MRRLTALVLFAVSLWLIDHTCHVVLGADVSAMVAHLPSRAGDPSFLFPVGGGLFGAIGGLIILFGGPGGAALAMLGGVIATGYAFYADQPFAVPGMRVWESDVLVSLALLFLGSCAAVMARH